MEGNPDSTSDNLRLPELGHKGQPGGRFVARAVSLTLAILAVLAAAAAVIATTVHTDVTIQASGTLDPREVRAIRAQATGVLLDVPVRTGDFVGVGQVVARIDPLALDTELAELLAQYRVVSIDHQRAAAGHRLDQVEHEQHRTQAEARLDAARTTLLHRMIEYGFGTDIDFVRANHRFGSHVALDSAIAEVRAADAELELVRVRAGQLTLQRLDQERSAAELDRLSSQIDRAQQLLKQTSLAAPISGVITTEDIGMLQGSFVQPGDALFDVVDPRRWRATLLISERDVDRIRIGDPVRMSVQALSDGKMDRLEGRIVQVVREPASHGSNPSPGQRGGSRAVVDIETDLFDEAGVEQFRRGLSVEGHIITRSGRLGVVLWNQLLIRLREP